MTRARQVIGTAFNRNLGGRNFDDLLVKKLVEVRATALSAAESNSCVTPAPVQEFKVKFKIDCATEEKAMFRLRTAAAKTRESVSGAAAAARQASPLFTRGVRCAQDDDVSRLPHRREGRSGHHRTRRVRDCGGASGCPSCKNNTRDGSAEINR